MSHEPTDTETGTPGGLLPEQVEDRLNVGTVKPEDHPEKDRAKGISDPPLDEEKEHERLNPGSGGKTPAVPGSGRDRDNA